ncbi:MBL fold metallo-hydrolase [Parasporobacterium paucivorans]|uniref:Phosphoribosyl 1,2-cyclic phosphodiesterase n=1 Tax=Parasporobacterium paucivorans DSM 15970 TaxID=1122934 RepID=A0A1M6F5V5_9FIRM|nr:MBL fold metallo-hydrolase [Parasporobacterium paucivorans]SHI93042.1 Phosphoribosyl 1,2-cyclic phosphodiesterase [Parasporobacterium paucivorans DSM 15970]
MNITTIASGSTGNCIYVGSGDTHILIDAGISKKRIEEGLMNSVGISLKDISAILITHEHIDHTNGLGVVLRKYDIPVYATQETVQEILTIGSLGKMQSEHFNTIRPDEFFHVDDLRIKPFMISHDAANPVAFRLEDKDRTLAVLTDLGRYDDYIMENIAGADAILLEANHDVNMVQTGSYPYYLKQRILSDKGHLSNENAGKLLSGFLHDKVRHIVLGHLSRENNYDMLAYETVRTEIMSADNEYKADDFPIHIAKYNCVSELIEF